MKAIKTNCILLLVLVFFGCREKYNLKIGAFPEDQPINLLELNSRYDEMNSDFVSPYFSTGVTLIFSSNAIREGGNFDLDARKLAFNQDKETGDFTFSAGQITGQNATIRNQLFEINSDCDERGPYSLGSSSVGINNSLFSRDCEGIYHIFLNEFENTGPFSYRSENFQISLLNENVSEMYPSFYGENYFKGADLTSQGTPELLLFTSDKGGQFDIFEITIPSGKSHLQFLKDSSPKTARKLTLNTSSNDHMPFVYRDLLVFSSDRTGGLGGYDLYYSMKTANGWTEPINFGPKINSEYDEFRPVVSDSWEFSNQVMIFSSNRPGGLGGFDLYFLGIPKF